MPLPRLVPAAGLCALGMLAACPRGECSGPAPTMQPAPPPAPPPDLQAAMPTAPWPTMPAPAGGAAAPPPPPPPGLAAPWPGAAGAPGASAEDARIRAALNGEWVYVETSPPTAEGEVTRSECRLLVHAVGARETCRTTTTLGPTQSWPCRASREPSVRTTASPYAVTVTNGEVVFTPGVATLVEDTTCTPSPAAQHTEMRARWAGTSNVIVFTVTMSGGPTTAIYHRAN